MPKPAESNDMIFGGTIGVPGGTGVGEFAGALQPLPAPANAWNRPFFN